MIITYARFKEDVKRSVEAYLGFLAEAIQRGQLSPSAGHTFLFPTTLVFVRTATHYAFELFGSRTVPGRLSVKENKSVRGFNHLVNGLGANASATYIVGTEDSQSTNLHGKFSGLTLTCLQHSEHLAARFPAFRAIAPKAVLAVGVRGDSLMAINAEHVRTVTVDRCLLTSNLGQVVRARYIKLLFGESVQADRDELLGDLESNFPRQPGGPLTGVEVAPAGDQQTYVAAGFTSLYLQGAAEPTLTGFLERHDEVIRRVFDAQAVFYQQKLTWREGNRDPSEQYIQPDVLVRRSDGRWVIVEFKLPLLDRQRVTTGKAKRREFIHAVGEGISQLFYYGRYFDYSANQEVARGLLGESPLNPKLVLVVGNSENVSPTEVEEARLSRGLFDLIDYDSLIRLYMAPLPSVPPDANP